MSMVALSTTIFTTIAKYIHSRPAWKMITYKSHKCLWFSKFYYLCFPKVNKLVSLKMPLNVMNKMIIHRGKQKCDLGDQTQVAQSLNDQVGAMNHIVDTTHKQHMFLHVLNDHTTFHAMITIILSKQTNLLVMLISSTLCIQPYFEMSNC